MLNVRHHGAIVTTVATLSEARDSAQTAGAPETFYSRIVAMGRRSLGRNIWEGDGWLVERVAPRYFIGKPGGERECEECGTVSDKMYVCDNPFCIKDRIEEREPAGQ